MAKKTTKDPRGECVRLVRKILALGATPEAVATRLGVSYSSVKRWDSEDSVPFRQPSLRMIPLLEKMIEKATE